MAINVHCTCGAAIDCENLETLVTLRCPACKRELTIEYKGAGGARSNAVLRVHEGPQLLGERFLIPVNEDLTIGSSEGSWLRLEGGEVAGDHCRVRLDRHGVLTIYNLGSPQGTWIDQARVVEGVLEPGQDLRVGFYRLRIEKQRVEDLSAAGAATVDNDPDVPAPVPLMVMPAIDAEENAMTWLVANRFVLGRWSILIVGWMTILFHGLELKRLYFLNDFTSWSGAARFLSDWSHYVMPLLGVTFAIAALRISSRVTLADRAWSIAGLVALGVIACHYAISALQTGALMQWFSAGGVLLVGVAMAVVVLREPREEHALGATFLGGMGVIMALIPTIMRLREHLTSGA